MEQPRNTFHRISVEVQAHCMGQLGQKYDPRLNRNGKAFTIARCQKFDMTLGWFERQRSKDLEDAKRTQSLLFRCQGLKNPPFPHF
jgi:hypothetical protein